MQISSQRLSPSVTPDRVSAARVDSASRGAQRLGGATEAQPTQAQDTSAADDRASSLARLDGFTSALMERLDMAAKNGGPESAEAFAAAGEFLEGGMARLRAGIENGTLSPDDIQRGVDNVFRGARALLSETGEPVKTEQAEVEQDAEGTDQQADVGAVVRERFSGFADSVMARIEGLELSSDQEKALVQATSEAFESATARLDAALFDPQTGDPIDRGTFRALFSEALASLQSQLGALFQDGGADKGVVYDARRSAEGLAPLSGSLDVAG